MWLLELVLISLVGGAVLGVGWRLGEDWWDKHQANKQ